MYPLKTTTKYIPDALAKTANIYTTVYLGNYVAGDFDEESGSHPGVDIVPMTPKDSVFAVLDGEIIEATKRSSEGNCVIIKHTNVAGKSGNAGIYYSCYLHLDSLQVAKGDVVKEGDIIGKSGNTGMSTGEHLHFQIDTWDAPFHPYWPFSTKEAADLGLGFFDAVNKGLGIDKAKKFTVNPLVFLDTVAVKKSAVSTESVSVSSVTTNSVNLASSNTPVAPVTPPVAPVAVAVTPATPVNGASGEAVVHTIEIASQEIPANFADVASNHKNYTAIEFLRTKGISRGNNGKYFPDASVTRSELVKLAFIASKKPISKDSKTYFGDVPAGSEFLPYINTAKELKIVQGYSDGTFGLARPVTRVEGLKILLGIFGKTPDAVDGPVYLDVAKSDWFAPFVLWSRENDVLESINGSFFPNQQMTRGEVAQVIYSLMN